MPKSHSKDCAELERPINRKLRKVGPNYGIGDLHRTSQGRYRFEMRVSVDPRDEAKLQEIVREVLRELPAIRQRSSPQSGARSSSTASKGSARTSAAPS